MKHFDYLDGIRGLLAFSVASSHIVGALTAYGPGRPLVGAYLAVDYFFILSGFVLSNYFSRKNVPWVEFAWIRFFRLWPLLAVTTLITFGVYFNNAIHGLYHPTHEPLSLKTVLLNISFLSATGIVHTEMLNNPAWSISIEFWLSAFVLIWIYRLPILITFTLGSAFYIIAMSSGSGLMVESKEFAFTNFGMLRGLAGMSIGVFLFQFRNTSSRFFEKLPEQVVNYVLIFFSVAICLFINMAEGGYSDIIAIIIILPFFSTPYFQNKNVPVVSFFSMKPFVYLGKISFSLYLIHTAVIIYILPSTYVNSIGIFGAFSLTAALSILAAHILHNIFEAPIQRLTTNWSRRITGRA